MDTKWFYYIITYDITEPIYESVESKQRVRSDLRNLASDHDGVQLSESCYLVRTKDATDLKNQVTELIPDPADATTYLTIVRIHEKDTNGNLLRLLTVTEPTRLRPLLAEQNLFQPRTMQGVYGHLCQPL